MDSVWQLRKTESKWDDSNIKLFLFMNFLYNLLGGQQLFLERISPGALFFLILITSRSKRENFYEYF